MFKKNPKQRLIFLIFIIVVLIIDSVMSFYQYGEQKEGMRLTSGILFGAMALFFSNDLYMFIKNQKRINSGA